MCWALSGIGVGKHVQRYTNPVLFLLVTTHAEMCRGCKDDGNILPSIESFQMRLLLPKVYYIFYEYFFKAVIGEGTWKQCFTGDKRFGTNILEAYAHAIIKTTTLHGCMITSPRTQEANYEQNMTWQTSKP
jgi:hypothetical protein